MATARTGQAVGRAGHHMRLPFAFWLRHLCCIVMRKGHARPPTNQRVCYGTCAGDHPRLSALVRPRCNLKSATTCGAGGLRKPPKRRRTSVEQLSQLLRKRLGQRFYNTARKPRIAPWSPPSHKRQSLVNSHRPSWWFTKNELNSPKVTAMTLGHDVRDWLPTQCVN